MHRHNRAVTGAGLALALCATIALTLIASPAGAARARTSGLGGEPRAMAPVPGARSNAATALEPALGAGVVLHAAASAVRPLNLDGLAEVGRVPIGGTLFAVAVTPDGKLALAARFGTGTVTPVNMVTRRAGTPIAAGRGPAAIAVNPAGTKAYVADQIGNAVTPINLRTRRTGAPIPLPKGAAPWAIAISADGSHAYVADGGLNAVSPINLRTRTVGAPIRVGTDPISIALTPDGQDAFVANYVSGTVSVVSLTTLRTVATVPVGKEPDGIAIAGLAAYVACFGANETDVVLLHSHRLVDRLATGVQPSAVATSSGGKGVYVANYGHGKGSIVAINAVNNTLAAPLPLKSGPSGLAYDEPERMLLLTGYSSGLLGLVETGVVQPENGVHLPAGASSAAVAPGTAAAWFCLPSRHEIIPLAIAGTHEGRIGRAITVGDPVALALVTPAGRLTAWVADPAKQQLIEVDLEARRIIGRIALGIAADEIVVAPGDKTALAADSSTGQIVLVDLSGGTAGSPIALGGHPSTMAVAPNGSVVMVADRQDGTVTPVSLPSGSLGKPMKVPGVTGVSFVASSLRAYAVSSTKNAIYDLTVGYAPVRVGYAGKDPVAVSVEPGAPIAMILDAGTARVDEFDLAIGRSVWAAPVGAAPAGLAVGYAGRL